MGANPPYAPRLGATLCPKIGATGVTDKTPHSFSLRIPDSYHTKTLKKHTPFVRFALYFHNQAIFQKSERSFFNQLAIDAKSALTFDNHPLVLELKFKMSKNGRFFMFSISALP